MMNELYNVCISGDLEEVKEIVNKAKQKYGTSHKQYKRTVNGTHLRPLLAAIDNNHVDVAEFLIDSGAGLNKQNLDLVTPLHMAASRNLERIVELLLERGAYAPMYNGKLETALQIAVEQDNVKIAKLLGKGRKDLQECAERLLYHAIFKQKRKTIEFVLKHLINPNSLDSDGMSPLAHATRQSRDIVKLVLDCGADVDFKTGCGTSPLGHAVNHERTENVKLLLRYEPYRVEVTNYYGETPLLKAVEKGSTEILNLLVRYRYPYNDINADLLKAIEKNEKDIIKMLLMNKTDADTDIDAAIKEVDNLEKTSPARSILSQRKKECIQLLLKYCVMFHNKNAYYGSPLYTAMEAELAGITELLLLNGANVNKEDYMGHTLIIDACRWKKQEMARLLVKYGANVNHKRDHGDTALHIATENGCMDTLKLLLQNGAKVDSWNEDGETALFLATSKRHGTTLEHIREKYFSIIKLLLENGAKTHLGKVASGILYVLNTPMHMAVRRSDLDLLKLFLNYDNDINVRDMNGKTALYFASMYYGNYRCLDLLVQNGADVNIASNSGETPLMGAARRSFRNAESVYCLLLNGAFYPYIGTCTTSPLPEGCDPEKRRCNWDNGNNPQKITKQEK